MLRSNEKVKIFRKIIDDFSVTIVKFYLYLQFIKSIRLHQRHYKFGKQ